MDSKRPNHDITSSDVRSELSMRVTGYRLLLSEYHTPLFHNQLLDAIKLHEEALQRPDPTPAERERVLDQSVVLDNMDERLHKPWRELHKRMGARQSLLAGIANYQRYLGAWLMLDYAGKHAGKCYDWASSIVKAIGDAGSGGMGGNSVDEDFRLYQHIFVRTVREMMLDQDHVEKRLRAASAGSSHPAGEIHRLIDQCEWQDLAASVVNDRRLAVTLFGAKQVNRDFWSAQFGRTVLQQIDGVRDRYFTELSTPTKYTLSKRARDLSAKKVAHVSHLSSVTPPSPASSRHADGSAAVAAAKSVCSKVASGLGLGRTGSSLRSIFRRSISTSSPGSGPDSTTQLIEEKEKAG